MAPSTIRKAIGAVKDQTTISIAKVSSNTAPELKVLVVKATSHDEDPADEKHVREIISFTWPSRGYANACVGILSKRIGKTRDWIVALKALMLVHRLLTDGHPLFGEEIVFASRRGMRVLNLSDFRDDAHSNSWDHAAFVRCYAMYLDEKVEALVYEKKLKGGNGDLNEPAGKESKKEGTPMREMKPERVLAKLDRLMRVFDRVLGCRPAGTAKTSRLVLVSLYRVVKESFGVYVEICEALGVLLDVFMQMEYKDCVKAFDAYVRAAKMIDELVGFYEWSKDVGIARSSEFPEVQRITDKLLGTLEGFLKEMAKPPKSPERVVEKMPEPEPEMNEIKALPAPESWTPPPPPQPIPEPTPRVQQETHELVNLRDDGVSADDQGNKFALALFSLNGEPELTSAWQNPAAETGKAHWELALVETSSNLARQKAALGGGLDPLLLNGMYDQGTVRQHVSYSQQSGGSASSVALPGTTKSTTPMLALPAPFGNHDPFAASLAVPPPSYVQMADMEKKQRLLVQEQHLWQQYGNEGMQGQVSLSKLGGSTGFYGMPQAGGYHHYTPY